MPTEIESFCCQEQTEITKLLQDSHYRCITKHPAFAEICLARYMLDVVYKHYCRDYGKRAQRPTSANK